MYDLHAHILPGVDDGAVTPEDTLAMSRVAAETGTKVALATPHRKDVTENWSVAYLRELISEMNAQNRAHGVELPLVLGMENHLDTDLPGEIKAGRALPMNGTRYILIEMPFFGRPDYIEDTLAEVQDMGLVPVLAHPERIEAFQHDPDMLRGFVEKGMLSQITSNSLIGFWGEEVADFTRLPAQERHGSYNVQRHSPREGGKVAQDGCWSRSGGGDSRIRRGAGDAG